MKSVTTFRDGVKVLAVVGSKTFDDKKFLEEKMNETMEKYKNIDTFVSGGARGADTLGENHAKRLNLLPIILKPDWKTHGKKAGNMRNDDIIKKAQVVLAFWDGQSKGTADSIKKAKKMGKRVHVYNFSNKLTPTANAGIQKRKSFFVPRK